VTSCFTNETVDFDWQCALEQSSSRSHSARTQTTTMNSIVRFTSDSSGGSQYLFMQTRCCCLILALLALTVLTRFGADHYVEKMRASRASHLKRAAQAYRDAGFNDNTGFPDHHQAAAAARSVMDVQDRAAFDAFWGERRLLKGDRSPQVFENLARLLREAKGDIRGVAFQPS